MSSSKKLCWTVWGRTFRRACYPGIDNLYRRQSLRGDRGSFDDHRGHGVLQLFMRDDPDHHEIQVARRPGGHFRVGGVVDLHRGRLGVGVAIKRIRISFDWSAFGQNEMVQVRRSLPFWRRNHRSHGFTGQALRTGLRRVIACLPGNSSGKRDAGRET